MNAEDVANAWWTAVIVGTYPDRNYAPFVLCLRRRFVLRFSVKFPSNVFFSLVSAGPTWWRWQSRRVRSFTLSPVTRAPPTTLSGYRLTWCLLADGASHDAPTSGHQHLCVSGDGRPNASRNPWIWGMGPLSDLASRILFVYAGLTRGFRPGLNVFEIAPRNLEFKGVIRPWSIAFGNTNP